MTVRTPLVIISGKVQQLPSGDSISVGLTLTPNITGFSISGGTTTSKTFTVTNSITLSGNDGTTLNIGAGGTLNSGAFADISLYAPVTQTMYIGTTPVAINRASGALALTGITSIDGNAATVTTNANLTGEVTSVGNAATLTNSAVIAKVLTGYASGAGTVAATDSILQAIQKLNGNVALASGGAVGAGNDKIFYENDVIVTTNYTIGQSAFTSGVTVTIATPAVFTLAGHGFIAGSQVIFSTTGALPTGLSTGINYYVITAGLTSNNFEVAATLSGTAINTSGTQSGVHSVAKVKNAMSTGPVSIADGVSVTVQTGSVWTVI
jgi:hypothetical protein